MAELKINTFPTGLTYSRNTKAPLESNKLFDTLALAQAYVDNVDANAYVGLTISVVADSNADNNGLYYIEQIADSTHSTGILVKVGSGAGSVAVETFAEARELATADNIGQVIYVIQESTEGEGEEAVVYSPGPYIVSGENTLSKLGTTSASGDIAADVSALQGDVSNLKVTVGSSESGLVKDVNDLKSAVDALPEVIVSDVKVDNASVVSNGVANIDLSAYAKSADVASKSEFDALSVKVGSPIDGEVAATGIFKLIDDTAANLRSEISAIPKFAIEVVSALPTENISNTTVYLVNEKESAGDLYTEYIYVNGNWENLGKQTVDFSSYSTTEEMNAAIAAAIASYVSVSDFNSYKGEVSEALRLKANAADVYSKTDADATFVKVEGHVVYSQQEKDKLAAIAEGAQVNVLEAIKVKVSSADAEALPISDKAVVVDLSPYAKSADIVVKSVTTGATPVGLTLTDGVLAVSADVYSKNDVNGMLAVKLASGASVNGKVFESDAVVIDSADIKLNAVISREDQGVIEEVYNTDDTIQGVLSNLSERIDNINTIVDGQITGVASVQAGNGISVSGEASSPVIGVKVANSTISSTTDGIAVKIVNGSSIVSTDSGLDVVWSELS